MPRIKFLETCSSDAPNAPFVAGQIVSFPGELPPALRSYIKRGQAVFLDETERAVELEAERAEPERLKGPNRRVPTK